MVVLEIPAPIRMMIYQCPKWIPNVIPLEEIPNLAESFLKRKMIYRTGTTKNKWPEFILKRNYVLFLTSFYLALRPNEAVNLKFQDFWKQPDGSYWVKIRGVSNKRKKDRVFRVPDELVVFLGELFNSFDYREFWENSEYLFPSYMDRSQHLSRYQWNEIFQEAIKLAGLWRKHPTKNRGLYTAYSLRHSRAVDILQRSNFNLWEVANLLGHSSLNVVSAYLPMCPIIQNHINSALNQPVLNILDKSPAPSDLQLSPA